MDGSSENRESGTVIPFRWTWFALLCAAVFLLLAFRVPNSIRKPSFVAEDGFAFFKQAYEEPFWRILFRPQAGYVLLIQRIIAELASFAPLEFVPLVYALASLVLTTASLVFLALPSFRSLIRSDALRAVIVLTLTFMPNADGISRICALHWYALFFLALVSIMPISAGRLAAGFLWVAAALSFWSQPVAIVCVPILAYRIWRATPGAERRWWIALTGVALAYPFTAESGSALLGLWRTPDILTSLRHAIGLRVFCFFVVGKDVSRFALANDWFVVMRLSLFCVGLCVTAALWPERTRPAGVGRTLALLSYYVLLLPVPYILRPYIVPDFVGINPSTWLGHERYFCASVLLLCVFWGVAYQKIAAAWKRHAAASLFLLCWLGLHTSAYVLGDYQSPTPWPHFARKIRQAEEDFRRTGTAARIAIQTNPYIFVIDVGIPPPDAPAQW